ncbi:MAG: alanyl-tRNA editing protein [Thermaceae bacterium]|nr:alanyl-tRNA editing protein [Thermaceae bacterium]
MRLYHEHPYESEFSTQVQRAWSEGGKHFAVLEQTLFYPTAGGQSNDTGTLNDIPVLDVREDSKAKGDIVHVLENPLSEGMKVVGKLDWNRRYRHMQRHTAEHTLAQAFWRAAGWETLSVNMSSSVCTIDFSGEPDEATIKQGEALANWAVYANTPIHTYWIDDSEVEKESLRRAPKVSGQIRVVEIEDWDKVACGGTHLARTGEAGPIKVIKYERYKGGTRIYFMAGWEALETFVAEHAILSRLGEKFSSAPLEVEKPIGNMQGEWYKVRGENAALKDELAERIMRELLAEFPHHTIHAQVSDNVLDAVGKRLAEWPGVLALLVAPGQDKARYVLLKHSSRPEDLQALWKEILEPLGAKGGGALVKLGVLPTGTGGKALEAFRAKLAI